MPPRTVNLNWRKKVYHWVRRTQFALLPAHCLLCKAKAEGVRDICLACEAELPRNNTCCPHCCLPLERAEAACGVCLIKPPPFTAAWIPFRYDYPLDHLVTRFKFGRQLAAGRVLGELMVEASAMKKPELPDLLIPLPLHDSRLRERGYNQALELARPLARALGLALDPHGLIRTRATSAQTGLDANARRRNVKGAFAVPKNKRLPAHVALFDDVMTTGATLREAARALRQAGAGRVDVWALARAPVPRD